MISGAQFATVPVSAATSRRRAFADATSPGWPLWHVVTRSLVQGRVQRASALLCVRAHSGIVGRMSSLQVVPPGALRSPIRTRTRLLLGRAALASAATMVAFAGASAGVAHAADGPVYRLAGGCYALKDAETGQYVTRDGRGYGLGSSTSAGATPFRLQATALGRYLLYGPDRRMPQATNPLTWRNTPAVAADWSVTEDGGALRLTSKDNGRSLAVRSGDRLTTTAQAEDARWAFVRADGCAVFPELQVGAVGEPLRGASPDAPVRGFVDTHVHVSAYRFLGGKFHCGRPWSPYGAAAALTDCPDHGTDGSTAIVENLLSHDGNLGARHPGGGWPDFRGWPSHDSLTHESTYWKWIERAWRGGLRLMVNDLVENRALCEMYPLKQNPCNEMVSARGQAQAMHDLQDYIDAQFGGPGRGFFRIVTSPVEARRVINDGKLAVVLGIEVSELLDCRLHGGAPKCTEQQIDTRLADLHALGVQSAFIAHKFDNALAGTTFDNGVTGLLVNIGNGYATGRWWVAQRCPAGQEPDNTPPSLTSTNLQLFNALGTGFGKKILNGSLPVYPPGPVCNPKGLSSLGRHLIRRMAEHGMIVEADHLSVRARNETLDELETLRYPGVISSHSWSDVVAQARLQRLGGFLAPYGNDAVDYVKDWARDRSTRLPGHFGIGYGSDSNGLGAQPGPRTGSPTARAVTYPYRTFDGGTLMQRPSAGGRTYDVNRDGVANYGLFPDWVEDLRQLAGDQIVEDLAGGAEAYLQLWERAEAW